MSTPTENQEVVTALQDQILEKERQRSPGESTPTENQEAVTSRQDQITEPAKNVAPNQKAAKALARDLKESNAVFDNQSVVQQAQVLYAKLAAARTPQDILKAQGNAQILAQQVANLPGVRPGVALAQAAIGLLIVSLEAQNRQSFNQASRTAREEYADRQTRIDTEARQAAANAKRDQANSLDSNKRLQTLVKDTPTLGGATTDDRTVKKTSLVYLDATTRSLPPIEFDAVLSFGDVHAVEVSKHPVETGAVITDHIVIQPRIVNLDVVFSDARIKSKESKKSAEVLYQNLLGDLRAARLFGIVHPMVPFKAVNDNTPQRDQFVLTALSCTRDDKTGNMLEIHLALQELVFVQTKISNLRVNAQSDAKAASAKDAGKKDAPPATPKEAEEVTVVEHRIETTLGITPQ